MSRVKSTRQTGGATPNGPRWSRSLGASVSAAGNRQEKSPATQNAAGSPAEPSQIQAELARLQTLDSSRLREEWRRLCQAEPPRISRDLLLRALAYRIQEAAFGGLPKFAVHRLGGAPDLARDEAAAALSAADRLKPGTRLVREWHGQVHSVLVRDAGFEFEGRSFGSLTQIAREITGAKWSGPRFFGLSDRSAGRPAGARAGEGDNE